MQTTKQNRPSKLSSLNRKTEKEIKRLLRTTDDLLSFEQGYLFFLDPPDVDSKIVTEMIWRLNSLLNDIFEMNIELQELIAGEKTVKKFNESV